MMAAPCWSTAIRGEELEIRAHVGHGRFGDVYRAWDPRLDREVALKLIVTAVRGRQSDASHRGRPVDGEGPPSERRDDSRRATHRRGLGVWMELVRGRTLEEELVVRGRSAGEKSRIGAELPCARRRCTAPGWFTGT